jgi:hypothetical protein
MEELAGGGVVHRSDLVIWQQLHGGAGVGHLLFNALF